MLVTDVLRTYATEWTELLPIVEFLVYTTPGPHGYTPRDLGRNWSLGAPLQKDLEPFVDRDMMSVPEYAKGVFRSYREVGAKVTGWCAATSEKASGAGQPITARQAI